MRCSGAVLVASLALWPAPGVGDGPQGEPPRTPRELLEAFAKEHGATTPAEQFRALCREYDEARGRYERGLRGAKSDEERRKVREESYAGPEQYTVYFQALARLHPGDPAARDAMIWNACHDPSSVEAEEAMKILARDYADSDGLGPVCNAVGFVPFAKSEDFLRAIAEKSPHREIRAQAAFNLALILKQWTDNAADLADADSPMARFFGEPVAERVRKDPRAMVREAERLFEQAREAAGDATYLKWRLAEAAELALYEMRDLAVGKPAPEIAADDLDGRPMKLSDFRGRVVVVSFWATWCGPCMALVPHERELVKSLEGKPFALLGINGDEDRDKARRAVGREGMAWPSWWDGGREGAIASRWNIRNWPAIYVIDRQGIIRHKWRNASLNIEEVEEAVADLLE